MLRQRGSGQPRFIYLHAGIGWRRTRRRSGYATTVYDYIHRSMPLTAPGSLTPPEGYSIVAYLLAENGVVPATAVIDATSLPKIRMPARDKFVADDRKGGPAFR